MLTQQRQLIAKVFEEANRPLSKDEVLVIGRKWISSLGSATVDRTIRKMCENFELVGLSFPGQPTRYELPAEKEHPHFICRVCEKVFDLDIPINTEIPDGILSARQIINNVPTPVAITSAQIINEDGTNILKIVFNGDKTFNANQSDANNTAPDQISIDVCIGGAGIDAEYNYTSLGETWGTPKIIRMPTSSNSNLDDVILKTLSLKFNALFESPI